MRKTLAFLALLFSLSATAQQAVGPSAITGIQCAFISASGQGTASIDVSGSWSGTIQAQISIAGQSPHNVSVFLDGVKQSTITANGGYTAPVTATSNFQVCGNTITGSATIWLSVAQQSANSGGGSGGSGTVTAGTQGEPYYNSTGSTVAVTYPAKYATNAFAGADVGLRAKACFVAAAAINTQEAICDSSGETTGLDITANPFDGASAILKPVWILPNLQLTTEVPIVVSAGTTRATVTPGRAELAGAANSLGANANSQGGSGLLAGSSFPKCGSTAATNTECLTATGATGGNGNTLAGTVTTVTNGTSGSVAVTGSGTAFLTTMTKGCYFMSPATRTATQAVGMIESVASDTSLVLSMNLVSTDATAATYATWCPVVSMGIQGQHFNGKVNQGITVHDLSIDAGNQAGSYAAANYYAAELSRFYHVHFNGYTAVGLDIEGNTPQTSGDYSGNFFAPKSIVAGTSGCWANTWGLVINGTTTGFQNGSPHSFSNTLFADGTACTGATTFPGGILMNGGNFSLRDTHCENTDPCLALARTPNCAIGCPLFAGNTAVPASIIVDRMDVTCPIGGAGSCGIAGKGEIDLGTDFAAPLSISLKALSSSSTSTVTNLLVDHTNSNVMTSVNNTYIEQYKIDGAGKVSYTDANPVSGTEVANAAMVCYSLVCSTSVGGVLTPYVGAAPGSTTQVIYNLAGAFAASANLTFAATSGITLKQGANSADALIVTANTTVAPTGNLLNCKNGSGSSVCSIDVSGNVSGLSFSTSGTNGGVKGLEGTGANVAAAATFDTLFPDSTLHCWHQTLNNSDKGCVPFAFTSPLVNTNGTLACATCLTSTSGLTFPITVAGTVTSGGIPYFNSTTQMSSSAILNTNILVKGGGAGGAPTNSLWTDDATTATYTGTGGTKSPVFTSTGTTAAFLALTQGPTSASVAPCNVANTHCIQAGTATTASLETDAPAQAQGIPTRTGVAATIQDGYSGDANHSATVTIGSGTSIGSTSLCSTAICLVGTYRVNVYVDLTTACGTTGTYVVNLIYTDDVGSKTVPVNLSGTGSVPATGVLTTTSTANFGYDSFILRSTGAASINYSTTAVACGTAGPMVGKLYLSVEPVQ